MAGEAAALLDELMGRSRNVIPGKEVREMDWSDGEVCKSYLCGFCPCDLFTNTRADIGTCDKIHDEKIRTKYQESDRAWKVGYEVQFLSELEKIVRSLDRRITHGKERLRRSAEAKQKQMAGFPEDAGSKKLRTLNQEINSRVMQLEELGQRGEVEGAQVMLKKVEALERDRERERVGLLRENSKTLAGFEVDANDFHEKMELCDVCGSFLVIGDSQSRVDAHLLGKQHLGYARIRAAITDLKTKLSEVRTAEIESRNRNESNGRRVSQEHRRQCSRSRERKQRSRSRERRQRSRSKERKQRSRSREGRQRSRSRERRQRSRSRQRKQRSRSREGRQRSRSREGRQRSRSREGRHRSRSREGRQRSRSRERRQRSRSHSRNRHHSRERRVSSSKNRRRHSSSRPRSQRNKRSHSRERRSHSRDRERSKSKGESSCNRDKSDPNDSSSAVPPMSENETV